MRYFEKKKKNDGGVATTHGQKEVLKDSTGTDTSFLEAFSVSKTVSFLSFFLARTVPELILHFL